MKIARYAFLTLLTAGISISASAQEPNPTNDARTAQSNGIQNGGRPVSELNGVPLYRVNVVQRDLDAVNYLHRSGSTHIGFQGTVLLPGAKGEAKVESQRGTIHVDAKFQGLTPASGFGPEYLTYVLWAITPDGTPSNLGEVLPAGTKNNIEVTTNLQSFGLIVTAEPYFAVKVPSDIVVLQNVILQDKTSGVLEKVNAKYTLLPKGLYSAQTAGSKTVLDPITRNEHSPLELYEAHNAYNIARLAGADHYAPDIMAQVRTNLKNADDMDGSKKRDEKMEITYAREAVQRAEDARLSSIRKRIAEERQAEVDARQTAEAQAQQSAMAAQQSQLDAAKAQAEAERSAAAKAQADAQRAQAEAAAANANASADAAREAVVKLRQQMRDQLNSILATKETPRGLVVSLSDVLFDTGKYTLKGDTKISLAKVAVIVASHPDLKLQVEGYTDSVGSDDLNQKLSENRANSVKAFLIANSVNPGNITSLGYGKSHPVADNGTSAGRAQNRRVELVISGPSIGIATQAEPTN
ncbi:OmpA family protein [Terriglobus saanensis]|uniref:OmpA/MotB domain protein n=1 Tax=Terriglobus saanensis (strain ATCC BAA-1853 / DSM 23119 / SP1PR4) TaxID=401053 RepID=E8V730_TERSS|nr:OmpA family protein [Terriglobus saanensis]ADV81670.1 OmpA/MotB domain protein [Terriglobus saanensis SP1PR4]